jgi:hypothetical protein
MGLKEMGHNSMDLIQLAQAGPYKYGNKTSGATKWLIISLTADRLSDS